MPNHQFRFLSDALAGCTVIDADHLINEMRMVKSQKECDQIRRASRILTHAFGYLSETPFHTMSERVVEATVCRETRLDGAEDFRMMVGRPREERVGVPACRGGVPFPWRNRDHLSGRGL